MLPTLVKTPRVLAMALIVIALIWPTKSILEPRMAELSGHESVELDEEAKTSADLESRRLGRRPAPLARFERFHGVRVAVLKLKNVDVHPALSVAFTLRTPLRL